MPRRLDDLGVHHGSELSSLDRGYLESWEPFLTWSRDHAFDLLEIGVGTGASLRVWRDWFPNARLAGLDVRRLVLDPPIPGCILVHGNQSDPIAFQSMLRAYSFQIIVDDGSHHSEDQIQTFLTLFPWMAPDAIYIVAGLDDHMPSVGGESERPVHPRARRAGSTMTTVKPRSAVTWFAKLASALAHREVLTHANPDDQTRQGLLRTITGVFFMSGCVVVTS